MPKKHICLAEISFVNAPLRFYVRPTNDSSIQGLKLMAHTFNRTRPAGFSARANFNIGSVFARVTAWNEARRTRAALSRLTAWIGL